jgi:PAS domain S-box-containing protein
MPGKLQMRNSTAGEISELKQKLMELKPGDHLCCIYETEEEHRSVLTPFMKQGLERGEKVLYIVDKRTSEAILGYLREEGLDILPHLKSKQLSLLSSTETYIKKGKAFDPDGMISLLIEETRRALAEGYSALRVTGEMTWALKGSPGSERLIEYEAKLNSFFAEHKCLAVCQYDRNRFEAGLILGVLKTHPKVIIGTRIYDNFYYIDPDELLGQEPEAAQLNNWIRSLEQQSRSAEKLRESELKYRTLIDNANMGIVVLQDGKSVYANSRLAEMIGYTDEEFAQIDALAMLHPEDREFALERIRQRFDQKNMEPELAEIRLSTKSGDTIWIEASSAVIQWQGRPALQSFVIDITERKRAERALKRSEATTRSLLNIPTDFAVLIDPEGRILDLNDTLAQALQIPREKAIGNSIWDVLPPDVRKHRKAILQKTLKAKEPFRHEDRIDESWFDSVLCPILNDQGDVERVAIISREITERKRMEIELQEAKDEMEARVAERTSELARLLAELRESEARLAEAQRIAHLGSWEWDTSQGDTVWSDEVFRIFGMKPQKKPVSSRDFNQRVHPDDRGAVAEATRQALENPAKGFDHQYRIVRPDGSVRYVHEYGHVTVDGKGNPRHVIGTTQDITEMKVLEAETQKLRADLAHLDRVVTLSTLTGAIAHEVNQPLTAILNNAQAALRYLEPEQTDLEEVREALKDIISDDKRARDVMRRLRTLLKKKRNIMEPFDLNMTVLDTIRLLHSETVIRNADITTDLDPGLPVIYGDRIQMQQVILNLVMNALEAVKDSPRDARRIEVVSRSLEVHEVRITVNDSGPGFGEDKLEDVFKPFYTTKAEGTGLGLTVCRSIVESLGGRMWAENRNGGGASVSLRFPAEEGDAT